MTASPREDVSQQWDLSAFFPDADSTEFHDFVRGLHQGLAEFDLTVEKALFSGSFNAQRWIDALLDLEQLEARRDHLFAYVEFYRTINPTDDVATRAVHTSLLTNATLKVSRSRLLSALRALGDEDFRTLFAEPALEDAKLYLDALHFEAATVLPEGEETLVHSLAIDGLYRWARLASSTLSGTTIPITWPTGEREEVAMALRHELLWDPRAEIRRAAFDGTNGEMERQSSLLAECMNGVAGFELSVAKRRNLDMVETAIRLNGIRRETAETMFAAVKRFAPTLHRYLPLKARLLGLDALGIQDRSAPIPARELSSFAYGEARELILQSLQNTSEGLAQHAANLFRSRHIEAIMKPGRQSGGFCMGSPIAQQSRVFVNYGGSFNSVAMLAHEIGHAFHNNANFGLRPWRQLPPSTLCETAAILYEHILRRSVYQSETHSSEARRAALGAHLDAAVNYLLRLPRDFAFEAEFLTRRKSGEVSVSQLCDLMRTAHEEWFGSALKGDGGDQWGWAYNRFLMDPDLRLYNFPYTFAFMLSICIADRFDAEGDGFLETYRAFLNASGSTPVEEAILSTLGYDITSASFWDSALARVAADIELLAAF